MSVNDTSRIIIDDSRAMLQIVASLTDDSRGIIYTRNVFIVQATRAKTVYDTPSLKHFVRDKRSSLFWMIVIERSIVRFAPLPRVECLVFPSAASDVPISLGMQEYIFYFIAFWQRMLRTFENNTIRISDFRLR